MSFSRLVVLVQFPSQSVHLASFEAGDLERTPSLGSPDHGGEHELEHRLLSEGVGDDLHPAALLDEQPLEQVRRAHGAAVADRRSQVRDAGFEVIAETRHGAGQFGFVVPGEPLGQFPGDGARGGLVGCRGPRLELRPEVLGRLRREVPHPVREAALSLRAREARLDRLDDAGRPVTDHQQRVAQTAGAHVLEERAHRLGILLRPRHQVQ